MIDKINKYFVDKKINAVVTNEVISGSYVTYDVALIDVSKFNKFNNKMEQELSYILGTNATLNVSNKITITINNKTKEYQKPKGLNINVGVDTLGNVVNIDFSNNPHWLIGGSTGSGKSVFLNNVIKSLLMNYNNCVQFLFIDLKKVEFYKYNYLEYNLLEVANDIISANHLLDSAINLMNKRYQKYQNMGVLDIKDYNKLMREKGNDYVQDRFTIIVIDELAELMLLDKKNIQDKLQRLLQLGRASGIYVISATQRPSADVLAGTLKVNYTTRICFKVASMYDSKTIINQKGGENLFGNGDGLILQNGSDKAIRFQAYAPQDDSILDKYKRTVSLSTQKRPFLKRLKDLFRL